MWFVKKKQKYYQKRAEKISKLQKNWQIQRNNLQRQNEIKNDYDRIMNKNPFKITTGKLALWSLFILCVIITIFTGWVTVQEFTLAYSIGVAPNFTPLIAMIGAVIGAAIDVVAYFAKSAKENSKGGITYEAAAAADFHKEERSPEGLKVD